MPLSAGAVLMTGYCFSVPADADPLAPENVICFAPGPLTGTAVPMNRHPLPGNKLRCGGTDSHNGDAVAFAKDLFARGILSPEDVDGLELSWDNQEAQIELIHRIALRKGFGSILAEGEIGAARLIGRDAMDYNDQVKGTGRGHFPPGIFALAHATSTRGADHLRGQSWAWVKLRMFWKPGPCAYGTARLSGRCLLIRTDKLELKRTFQGNYPVKHRPAGC